MKVSKNQAGKNKGSPMATLLKRQSVAAALPQFLVTALFSATPEPLKWPVSGHTDGNESQQKYQHPAHDGQNDGNHGDDGFNGINWGGTVVLRWL